MSRKLRMTVPGFARRILQEQPYRFVLSVLLLTAAGLVEGVGVAALVPLLELLGQQSPATSGGGAFLAGVLRRLGLHFSLPAVLGFVLVTVIATQVLLLMQQRVVWGSIYRYSAELGAGLYADSLGSGWLFFVRHKSSDLINAVTVEVGRVTTAYANLNQMLSMAVVVAVYGSLAALLSWQLLLLVAATGLAIAALTRGRVSRGARLGAVVTELNQDVQSEALENFGGAKLIKGCAAETVAVNRFRSLVSTAAGAAFKIQMNAAWIKAWYDAGAVAVILAGVYAAVTVLGVPSSSLLVFLMIFYRISPRLSNLQVMLHGVVTYLPALERIDELRATAHATNEPTGDIVVAKLAEGVRFDSVCFSYEPGRPILRNVSLTVRAGKTTAIVGPSGSGKTTLIDLVMCLVRAQSGSLTMDDVAVEDLDVRRWRSRIGYVAQDTVLFHATVKENIAWGAEEADDEVLGEAARLANADEFIEQLREGWNTVVGDRGVRLSGGQRQRIALARAIARRPEILILDEATSALDAESEAKIQQAVDRLAETMTILVVTHRIAAVRHADYLYVLEGGAVVEQGTYGELVAANGRFAALRQLQALDEGTSGPDGNRIA